MQRKSSRLIKGFSLIEMLLVLVIISAILVLGMGYYQQQALTNRFDKAAAQMQQILVAGMSYYINNGSWPSDIATLQTGNYLPTNLASPWGPNSFYTVANTSTPSVFYVSLYIPAATIQNPATMAQVIAGRLPLGFTNGTFKTASPADHSTTCTTSGCYAIASVNVPGYSLNTATAVNFAGVYKHGGCVPAPPCPTGMSPQIFAVPVSVQGDANPNTTSNLYPISGFTVYAIGESNTSTPGSSPSPCVENSSYPSSGTPCGSPMDSPANPSGYWRVCAQVTTEAGSAGQGSADWGSLQNIVAFTRCAPTNEYPVGSGFTVYSP